jgi:uridine kinase
MFFIVKNSRAFSIELILSEFTNSGNWENVRKVQCPNIQKTVPKIAILNLFNIVLDGLYLYVNERLRSYIDTKFLQMLTAQDG